MSTTARGGVVVSLGIVLAASCGFAILRLSSGEADSPHGLAAVGPFRVGSALGEERAGFSGRPKLQVFTTADDPAAADLAACLLSAEVRAELDAFTPILIDARAEPEVETTFRERDGLAVIVRGLNGGFLGALRSGFPCERLVWLLRTIREHSNGAPEKSPIYARLLLEPEAIDELVDAGETDRAVRFLELLRELEGEGSPAVAAVEARIFR